MNISALNEYVIKPNVNFLQFQNLKFQKIKLWFFLIGGLFTIIGTIFTNIDLILILKGLVFSSIGVVGYIQFINYEIDSSVNRNNLILSYLYKGLWAVFMLYWCLFDLAPIVNVYQKLFNIF